MDDKMIDDLPAKTKRFEGFRKPEKPETGFYHVANEWTDITSGIDNLAELKIIEYIMRHTWGFKEYDSFKHITVDEFMHGRLKADRVTRMDKGTGLKSDRSVKDGIKAAIEHGYIICDIDASNKAKTRKSYKLKMRQVVSTPPTGSIYLPESQNLPPQQVDTTHHPPSGEKETLERNFEKNTRERKNDASEQNISTQESSFSPSLSSQSSISEEKDPQSKKVVFTEKQMIVYKLAEERKYSHLKKDAKHKKHCKALVEGDILIGEKMDSLEQFCREKLSHKGPIDLCLGNLVSELNGWLQVQRLIHQPTNSFLVGPLFSERGHSSLPPAVIESATTISDARTAGIETTDDHIIEKMSHIHFGYKDNGDLNTYLEYLWNIRDNFGLDNEVCYDLITNAYRGTLRLNDASMQDFFEELSGMLRKDEKSVS
jgi:hypothetical protein